MPASRREITRTDIVPGDVYIKERAQRRSRIVALKRHRRVEVGPFATFYFENYETMLQQVHEMLYIEKGGEEQIADELRAYNPLVPKGDELVATLMFEIDDAARRSVFLRQLTNVETTAFIGLDQDKVMARPEADVARTASDGKTSSVHFLHFPFTPAQIVKFRTPAMQVVLGIAHRDYAHMAVLTPAVRQELARDFA